MARYNEWGNGLWQLQKAVLLGEQQKPTCYFLAFSAGSDPHEQMAKLKNITSGKIFQDKFLLES